MKKFVFAGMLAMLVATPAQAFFKSQVNAVTTVDDFDGSTNVIIKHGHLSCKALELTCPSLAFSWTSSLPNEFFVLVKFNDSFTKQLYSIRQLQISIDGKVQSFDGTGSTSFNSTAIGAESEQSFVLPLSFAEQLTSSQNIKMRIVTDKGNVQADFVGGKRPSAAEKHFKLFLDELNKQKN